MVEADLGERKINTVLKTVLKTKDYLVEAIPRGWRKRRSRLC